MAGAAIELDVSEVQELTRTLIPALQDLLGADRDQLLTDIGVEIEGQTKDRFDEQTAPDGSRWEPWSPVTKRLRAGSGGHILVRSGELQESITHVVEGGKLQVGSGKVYAAVHQYGHTFDDSAFGAVTIPARPYLDPDLSNSDDRAALGMLVEDFVREHGGGVVA